MREGVRISRLHKALPQHSPFHAACSPVSHKTPLPVPDQGESIPPRQRFIRQIDEHYAPDQGNASLLRQPQCGQHPGVEITFPEPEGGFPKRPDRSTANFPPDRVPSKRTPPDLIWTNKRFSLPVSEDGVALAPRYSAPTPWGLRRLRPPAPVRRRRVQQTLESRLDVVDTPQRLRADRSRLGVRQQAKFEAFYRETDVERLTKIRYLFEQLGVPRRDGGKVRGRINNGTQTKNHGVAPARQQAMLTRFSVARN